jgi:hypothetical protein
MNDDLSSHERELFAALPRQSAADPIATERLVARLHAEGLVRKSESSASSAFTQRPSRRAPRIAVQLAAAVALFAVGALTGARIASRGSLERELARTDLGVADRVLLLQRAGSAYVTAANGYADATKRADSTAVEVANQVLRGAAHAVVRSSLNSRTASDILNVLQARDTTARKPILWY